MTLPRPMTFDRGEELTPQQVAERVRPRRLLVPPHEEREFTVRNRVVVHPAVFEAIVLTVEPYASGPRPNDPWARSFYVSTHLDPTRVRTEVRVCGLLMETDPCLRYDEVVLRREERL